MWYILLGLVLLIIAQCIAFIQIQGQFLYMYADKHPFIMALLGIPISYLFVKATAIFTLAFDGKIWPGRLIMFAIGMIVFSVLSSLLFKEHINTKTVVCLILALIIVILQIFWK